MQDINKQVGQRIRQLRQAKRFSQESLADTSGIHRSHMGEIERGECGISVATLLRVSWALRVPMTKLLKGM